MKVKSSQLVAIIIAAVVIVAIAIVVGFTSRLPIVQASVEAVNTDALFNFMLVFATVVFIIVEAGILYSVIRFRRKPGDETDGPNIHGNTTLEIVWTAIPAVLVIILTFYSWKVFADMETPQDNEIGVGVLGQQFSWSFHYYDPNKTDTFDEKKPADAAMAQEISDGMVDSELTIPVNQPMRMDIQAKDVLHAFYIPEFRIKQDAIPGRTTTVRFTPNLIGDYTVECTELCGQGHATMHNKVHVVSQQDFDKYIAQLRQKAIDAINDPTAPAVGEKLVASGKYPCGSCHTDTAAGVHGTQGPDWDGIYTRALNNTDNRLTGSGITTTGDAAVKEYLNDSIINPNLFVVPGFPANLMPKIWKDPTQMSDNDRAAIVNFLMTQK